MPASDAPFARRFAQYLRERFPLPAHTPLVAAFGLGVMAFGAQGWPGTGRWLAATAVVLAVFFQLRVADEHKDAAEDAAFRPERPVPRGLVTLAELRRVAGALVPVQLALAAGLGARPLGALALAWAFAALMTKEFFAPRWLKARPAAYLFSHLFVMPLLDLFLLLAGAGAGSLPAAWFAPVVASYAGAGVLEVGRKMRAPEDERAGVEMYTQAWGATRALAVWLAFALASAAALWPVVDAWARAVLGVAWGALAALALLAPRRPGLFARLEAASGLWLLAQYAALGFSAMGRGG